MLENPGVEESLAEEMVGFIWFTVRVLFSVTRSPIEGSFPPINPLFTPVKILFQPEDDKFSPIEPFSTHRTS
jgi:hypothetical protein